MTEYPYKQNLKLAGTSRLEMLHDSVICRLDSPAKAGIWSLLKKNNRLLKKQLYKHLLANKIVIEPELFSALDNLLEVHARECYTIGYLDGAYNKAFDCKKRT